MNPRFLKTHIYESEKFENIFQKKYLNYANFRQLTKGIDVPKGLQVASYIAGSVLIILGIFGFFIGLRGVVSRNQANLVNLETTVFQFQRHRKHLKKLHARDQKRKETTLHV